MLIDYLAKEKTTTWEYYSNLEQLKGKIRKKRPGYGQEEVLLHHENSLAHTFANMIAKLHKVQFKLLLHPPHFPDLASSDFSFCQNSKHTWLERNFCQIKGLSQQQMLFCRPRRICIQGNLHCSKVGSSVWISRAIKSKNNTPEILIVIKVCSEINQMIPYF